MACLSRITPSRFEKFRGAKLVDGPTRGVGGEIRPGVPDEIVEAADDFRVSAAGAELGQVEEQDEADEQHEERNGA